MTVRICGFHNVQFYIRKRKLRGRMFLRALIHDAWPSPSVAFTMYNFVCAKGSLKGQCHEIFDFKIFHVSVSPKPLSIPLVPFQIFLQIRWNIRSSRCTTGIAGTGGKFTTGVIDTSGELPLVSLTPAANLLRYHWHWWQIFKDGCKFFFKFTNPQTFGLNLQSQISKFLRYASSPIL